MARTAQPLDPGRESALLAAAASEFTRWGYQQASLNRIIAAAGWSKSSFYHYFPDKQRLHDHVVSTLRARVEPDLEVPDLDRLGADSFWTAMTGLLQSLAGSSSRHPEAALLSQMFHQPSAARGSDGQLTLLRRQVAGWCARAIDRGRVLGVVRDDIPRGLIRDLAMSTVATTDQWNLAHAGDRGTGPDAAVWPGEVVDLVRRLVGRPAP